MSEQLDELLGRILERDDEDVNWLADRLREIAAERMAEVSD